MSKNQNITESNSVSVAKTEQFVNEDKEVKRGLNDLKKFLELAKNYSNTILVLQHYERSEIISGHPEVGNKLINQTCQKLGIVPISLEPYFRRSIEDGINPYRDNDEIHPNNVGQRLIADAILVKLNLKNTTFFEHSIHKKNKILSRENF